MNRDYSFNDGKGLSVVNGYQDYNFNEFNPIDNFPPAPPSEVQEPEPVDYQPLPVEFGGNTPVEILNPTPLDYYPNVTGIVAGNVPQLPNSSLQQAAQNLGAGLMAGLQQPTPTPAPTPTPQNITANQLPPIESFEKTKKLVKWGLIVLVVVVVGFIAYSVTNKEK